MWETINYSKLGYFEGVLVQLCGFLGGWEGCLNQFEVICLGFLIKGLLVYLKSNDIDCYTYVFNVCFSFIVAF